MAPTSVASATGQLSWPWFRGNSTRADQMKTLERYLDLATECMDRVQRMPSLQVNRGFCQYLAIKLKLAVQQARACLNPDRPHPPGRINASHQGSFQLLFRLAKDVEDFIHTSSSHDHAWVRGTLMWRTPSEHASMLGYDLDICREVMCESILRNERGAAMRMMTKLSAGRRSEVDIIRLRAMLDQNRLLEKLTRVLERQYLSEDVPDPKNLRELAAFVLGRILAAAPPTMAASHGSAAGPSALSSCEVDFDSLKLLDRGHLAATGAGNVDKITWLGDVYVEKTFHAGPADPAFVNEISILAGLQSHPNVVPLMCYAKDAKDVGGYCSLVMELMEGDLSHLMRTRLRRNRGLKAPFTISEAVDIMLQIAQGVDHLHGNRIVHRDLKARNILFKIAKDYVYVKVSDFGLSKSNVRSITLNQTMSTGTTRWMGPELLKRADSVAATNQASTSSNLKEVVETLALKHPFKCDIYSLGMVFYEILTGRVPFHATSSNNEVKRMVLDGHRPVLPNDCPLRLDALIERCWLAEASSRPRIGEICAELRYLRCVLMTGGDVDNCDPIDPAILATLLEQAIPLAERAIPLERAFSFPAGTSLPLDEAFLSSLAVTQLERAFTSGAGTSPTADGAMFLSPQYTGACSVHMAAACAVCASG